MDKLSHTRRNWMPAYAITFQVITTLLLCTRIATRFKSKCRLGLDDALISVAWLVSTAFTVLVVLATCRYGFDRHVWDIPKRLWSPAALIGWLTEATFFWSTCFTKVSVLLFYRRIVAGTYSRRFKWIVWSAIGFVVTYTIAFQIMACITCQPVQASWRMYDELYRQKYHCLSLSAQAKVVQLAGSISVVSDFYSVMLPAVLLQRVKVSKRQRWGLTFIFGLGLLVVAAGIVRTIFQGRFQVESIDKTWFAFNALAASIAECNLAIICACAPSLNYLFGRFFASATSSEGSSSKSKSVSTLGSQFKSTLKMSKAVIFKTPIVQLDQSSFRQTHENGLDNLYPVAEAYSEELELPGRRAATERNAIHSSTKVDAITGTVEDAYTEQPQSISLKTASDDEASLVKAYTNNEFL